jgi:hypothetical protein
MPRYRPFAAAAFISVGLLLAIREPESPAASFESSQVPARPPLDHRLHGLGMALLGANTLWPRHWLVLLSVAIAAVPTLTALYQRRVGKAMVVTKDATIRRRFR